MINHVHNSLIPYTKNTSLYLQLLINACIQKQIQRNKRERKQERENFAGTICEHKARQQMGSRMGIAWWMIAMASAAMASTVTAADTHEVGGDKGWGVPSEPTFYPTWAADETFNVGDTLEFKWTGMHNVVEVTKDEYENCTATGRPNGTSPVIISLGTAGPKYFICTVGPHCSLGQKLSVTVGSKNSTTPAPPSSAPASLTNALSAAIFTIGSIFFTCL